MPVPVVPVSVLVGVVPVGVVVPIGLVEVVAEEGPARVEDCGSAVPVALVTAAVVVVGGAESVVRVAVSDGGKSVRLLWLETSETKPPVKTRKRTLERHLVLWGVLSCSVRSQ